MPLKAHWHRILLFLALVMPSASISQKAFEGVVTYNIQYTALPDGQEGVDDMLPKQMMAYMSENSLRYQQFTALNGEYTFIQPTGIDSVYHCIYLPNQRVLWSKANNKEAARYRVVVMDENKTWEGFKLNKVRLQRANERGLEAWVDMRYQNPFKAQLPDLPYLPLVFEMEQGGVRMLLTAVSTREEPLDATYFELPSNAERVSERVFDKLLN